MWLQKLTSEVGVVEGSHTFTNATETRAPDENGTDLVATKSRDVDDTSTTVDDGVAAQDANRAKELDASTTDTRPETAGDGDSSIRTQADDSNREMAEIEDTVQTNNNDHAGALTPVSDESATYSDAISSQQEVPNAQVRDDPSQSPSNTIADDPTTKSIEPSSNDVSPTTNMAEAPNPENQLDHANLSDAV